MVSPRAGLASFVAVEIAIELCLTVNERAACYPRQVAHYNAETRLQDGWLVNVAADS